MYKRLFPLQENIKRKERMLQKLKDKVGSAQAVHYKQKSKSYNLKNIMEDEVCRLIFLENEIMQMKKEFEEISEKVLKNIESIDNKLYRDILFLRYICFEKWEDIADTLGYSVDHTYTLHRKAKKVLENITVHNSV